MAASSQSAERRSLLVTMQFTTARIPAELCRRLGEVLPRVATRMRSFLLTVVVGIELGTNLQTVLAIADSARDVAFLLCKTSAATVIIHALESHGFPHVYAAQFHFDFRAPHVSCDYAVR
jgi:hypothetical protein